MNILTLIAFFLMGLGIGCIILHTVANKLKDEYEQLLQMSDKYIINANEMHLIDLRMRGNLLDVIDDLWQYMHNSDACMRRTYNHIENTLMDDYHDDLEDAKKDIDKSIIEYHEVTDALHRLLEADIPGIKGEEMRRLDESIHNLTTKIESLREQYRNNYGEEYK